MKHAVGALLVVAFVASHARAQESGSSSALAEQLFNQGRDLMKANQYAEACPKFEASLRYDPVLGTRLNLATCYEHVGKLASAWGLYRESIELARKAGDTRRAEFAQRQAAALEPRLPRLAITAPSRPPAGFAVKRGDTAVDAGALGVALYVDPGTHTIVASAPGFEPFTVTVTLVEGETETLVIPALIARPAATKPEPEAETEAGGEIAPASPARRYVAFGLGGAGAVAAGVGLVFGARARSAFNEAKALCGDDLVCTDVETFNQDRQLVRDARSHATKSTVLLIGGGAAVAAGVVVLLTARRQPERATARLVPVTHHGGVGVALTGTF